MATLKIEGARFMLTMDPTRRIVTDGAIVVDGQRITHVGKTDELRSTPADRVIDATEMVVTPGLCNGHIHLSYAHAVRGIFPDDLNPSEYLTTVFSLQSEMTEEEEYHTSLLAITELLKYGTTCFLDPGSTKYLGACVQAYQESGCRVIVGTQVTDKPNPVHIPVTPVNEATAIMEETIRRYDGALEGRVRAWAMPFSADYSTRELLVAAKGLADKYGTGVTMHQQNNPPSVELHLKEYGKSPVEYLEEIGALGPNVVLAHAIGLDEREVDALGRTGAKVVMCPTAAMKMGRGTTSKGLLPEMLERGVCVGIGTDAGNSSNLIDTTRSMYLVAIIYKDARQSTGMVPAETALEMATIEGAKALGLDGEIGSIEVGKKADLVLFDTQRPEWRAIFNPVNSLVYNSDGRSVHTVIVDGRVVVEDSRPLFTDERRLTQKMQELGEGLLARTGVSFPPKWPVV